MSLSHVEGHLRDVMRTVSGEVPGMIVLLRVADDTRVLAAGQADVDSDRPMSAQDSFPVASITKSMVAAAVMRLVARGRIALEDPVERWLPETVPQGSLITLKHLLSHQSGLHDPPARRLTPGMGDREVVSLAAEYPLDFPPGSTSAYSNIGYMALGLILAEATGTPLGQVLHREIFRPAKMAHTRLGGSFTVVGHDDGVPLGSQDIGVPHGSGSVVSTAQDVDRFYHALWSGDLVPLHMVDIMARSTGPLMPNAEYGLGLWRQQMWCGTGVGHSGSGPGVATKAWRLEGTDRSVVVLVNDADGQATADALADAALCPPDDG